MNDEASYDEALARFTNVLQRYEGALEANDLEFAQRLFGEFGVAWERLRKCRSELESDGFLVYAFSSAIGAGSAVESERIYGLMSDQQRAGVDFTEQSKPGLVKIWLR